MDYDPTQYLGAASYYLRGRPAYAADLPSVLADELGLDGSGHLVDVGSGPGIVGVQLARLFGHVTLVEPDSGMPKPARMRQLRDCARSISCARPPRTYPGSA